MSEKPKLSVFQVLSRIFLWIVSGICLLLSINYLILSLIEEPMYGPLIVFLLLTLLFIPLYARLFKSLGQSFGEGASKAGPYVRGGLFVLRLFAVLILTIVFTQEFDRITYDLGKSKNRLFSLFNVSASKGEMAQLINYIRSDQRTELEAGIYEILNQERKINYPLLIAENFKVALNQAKGVTSSGSDETYPLNERLVMNVFSTIDTIFASLQDYKSSEIAKHIEREKMMGLLIEYGEYYLERERFDEASRFFYAARQAGLENPDVVLDIADIYLKDQFLELAAARYEEYSSLMKNDGKGDKIPKRIKKFLEDGRYGSNLQKSLFECWLHDLPMDPYASREYYESINVDYVDIGGRLYGPFWGNASYALFGFQNYYYYESDSAFCGFAGCVSKLMGEEPAKMSVKAIEKLTGMVFYSDTDLPFTHISPEIIKWARKNLVPDPALMFVDKQARRVYNVLFRDPMREKALAYAFLSSLYDANAQAAEYQYRMYDENFHGTEYLSLVFLSYAQSAIRSADDNPWELTINTGFWLRRIIDGSADECWNLLSAIMNQYDQAWFEHVWEGWEIPPEYQEGPPDDFYPDGV